MKHTIFRSLALFSVLVLVGNGCLSSNNGSEPAANGTDTAGGQGLFTVESIQDAISLGQSLECTWSSEEGSGTTLVKGDKSFSEMTTSEGTSYILGGEDMCTYIWTDEEGSGVVFCPNEELEEGLEDLDAMDIPEFESESESEPDDFVDPGVDFNCVAKNVSDSAFNPPNDIEFVDPFEQFMNLGF